MRHHQRVLDQVETGILFRGLDGKNSQRVRNRRRKTSSGVNEPRRCEIVGQEPVHVKGRWSGERRGKRRGWRGLRITVGPVAIFLEVRRRANVGTRDMPTRRGSLSSFLFVVNPTEGGGSRPYADRGSRILIRETSNVPSKLGNVTP